MARKRNKLESAASNRPGGDADTTVLNRVQELTWAMLDEQLTDDEFRLLENLLLSDDQARETYIECIQLHTDLMAHYAAPATAATSKGAATPVLSFLNAGTTLGIQSPAAETQPNSIAVAASTGNCRT